MPRDLGGPIAQQDATQRNHMQQPAKINLSQLTIGLIQSTIPLLSGVWDGHPFVCIQNSDGKWIQLTVGQFKVGVLGVKPT